MTAYSSEDYCSYRLQRAKETVAEVETHISNQFWNTAINRMYYACFYVVAALLIKNGIETSSHSGTRQQFGQMFVKTGKVSRDLAKHYTDLFEKRNKSDYNDFYDYDEKTVKRLFPITKEFTSVLEELIINS